MQGVIPNIQAVGLSTRKAQGEAAEAVFLAKVARLGFGVAKTWGDSERYDFILDSGTRLWRVQVKSTQCFVESHYSVRTRGCRTRYTSAEIDFIAAYIVPEDLWYVIPVSAVAGRNQIYLSPSRTRPSNHGKYREAWCQMACTRDANGPSRLNLKRLCERPEGGCKLS